MKPLHFGPGIHWALRIHALELVIWATLAIFLAAAIAWLAFGLASDAPSVLCLESAIVGTDPGPGCSGVDTFFEQAQSAESLVGLPIVIFPPLVGAMLGSVVVAGEIETGTAQLAWSIRPSRMSWFAAKLIPLLLVCLALVGVIAALSTVLFATIRPWQDPLQSFTAYGQYGPVLVARGFSAFMIGALIGAMIGRTVAAVALSFVVSLIVLQFIFALKPFGATFEVLRSDISPAGGDLRGPQAFVDRAGVTHTLTQVLNLAPTTNDAHATSEWIEANYQTIVTGVPGDSMLLVLAREVGLLLGVGGLAALLAAVVVRLRRPY